MLVDRNFTRPGKVLQKILLVKDSAHRNKKMLSTKSYETENEVWQFAYLFVAVNFEGLIAYRTLISMLRI